MIRSRSAAAVLAAGAMPIDAVRRRPCSSLRMTSTLTSAATARVDLGVVGVAHSRIPLANSWLRHLGHWHSFTQTAAR